MCKNVFRILLVVVFYKLFIVNEIYAYYIKLNNELGDTIKPRVNKKKLKLDLTIKSKSLSLQFKNRPNTSHNHKGFTLISDYTYHGTNYPINSVVQKYHDENYSDIKGYTISEQRDYLLDKLKNNKPEYIDSEIYNNIVALDSKTQYYALWRANLLKVRTEEEMNLFMSNSTNEIMDNGFDDIANDLFPFVTMLMREQKNHHYDNYRVISTRKNSNGIVNALEILNALSSLDDEVKAGVCRDTHDMGLRLVRSIYKEYLDSKYPGNDYDVDDYIFLQAWVTYASQHITLVVVDPENPRNIHELDWGRVYSKKQQEGVEIGNMVGSTVRLWQFNPSKNVSNAIGLVKSSMGNLFDNEVLVDDEKWKINGIFAPDYTSKASYLMDFGKNSQLGISVGSLNAGQYFMMGSYRSGKHKMDIGKYLKYDGMIGIQAAFIDDTKRKTYTLPWANWQRAINFSNSSRYVSNLKTSPVSIKEQFFFKLFFLSQIEIYLGLSKLNCSDENENNKLFETGDGNIWTTWGTEMEYIHPAKNFSLGLNIISRNFLIPKDVRLLSPNPFELVRNATICNNGIGALLYSKLKHNLWEIEPEVRYEQNRLGAKFLYVSTELSKKNKKGNNYFVKAGYFEQLKGIEYYWYSKSRLWFSAGMHFNSSNFELSLFSETIQNDVSTFGISLTKYFGN